MWSAAEIISNLKARRSGTDFSLSHLTKSGMRALSASPTFKPPKFSAPTYSSGSLRADVLVIMARRFPIARLFGVRFRECDLVKRVVHPSYRARRRRRRDEREYTDCP